MNIAAIFALSVCALAVRAYTYEQDNIDSFYGEVGGGKAAAEFPYTIVPNILAKRKIVDPEMVTEEMRTEKILKDAIANLQSWKALVEKKNERVNELLQKVAKIQKPKREGQQGVPPLSDVLLPVFLKNAKGELRQSSETFLTAKASLLELLEKSVKEVGNMLPKHVSLKNPAEEFDQSWKTFLSAKVSLLELLKKSVEEVRNMLLPKADASNGRFGIWRDGEGNLWIDGRWIPYGSYKADQRNERIEAAQQKYADLRVHAMPAMVEGWIRFD